MKTEKVKIATLSQDKENVRLHDPTNIDAIKHSLLRFGQQKPIVVGAGGKVIAGNGTLAAAESLGWVEIEIVRTKLEGKEAIAFAIADNRTAELAEWNEPELVKLIEALESEDEDLARATGFSEEDLAELKKEEDEEIEDEEGEEGGAGDMIECPNCGHTWGGDG